MPDWTSYSYAFAESLRWWSCDANYFVVNKSVAEGFFPSGFKNGHVIPVLKENPLGKEDVEKLQASVKPQLCVEGNWEGCVKYRILSQLADSTITKSSFNGLTERIIQLKQHSSASIVIFWLQCRHCSHFVGLVRAAFDTIDPVLHTFRQITELVWYIWPCTELVIFILDGQESTNQAGKCPFSWSSASLWCAPPRLRAWTTAFYTVHHSSQSLSTVIQGHSILHHLYADDSQLYISFTSDDSANQLGRLKSCLDSVLNWMLHNRLKLNPSKTDFLLIGRKQQRKKYLSRFPTTLMGIDANPSASARNLGVVFDQNFNFRKHISQVCSSCFCHIRDLHRIRRHLNLDNAKSVL